MSTKKLDTVQFIRRAREKHGNKYDYSKTVYVNARTKLCIICPEHGEMWMTPVRHLKSGGCTFCGKIKAGSTKKTTKEFVSECKVKYPEKDTIFDKAEYKGSNELIELGCQKHGYYWVRATSYLNDGCDCPKCNKLDLEDVKKEIVVHGHDYGLDNLQFKTDHDMVEIECSRHGKVLANLRSLRRGGKCNECAREDAGVNARMSLQNFQGKSEELHGKGTWKYGKVDLRSNKDQIILVCGNCEKNVRTRPDRHLTLQKGLKHRCPHCSDSRSTAETLICEFLNEWGIDYSDEKTFDTCKDRAKLRWDFYIPEFNLLIERQGEGHHLPVSIFGGEQGFKSQQKRDKIKYDWAEKSPYTLKYIHYFEDTEQKLADILTEQKSLKEIKEFLEENKIQFTQKDNRFTFGKYHIEYVVAKHYPVNTPKCNIEGVRKDHFLNLSQSAEDKDEFICWVKDFEWSDKRKQDVLKSYWLHSAGKLKDKWFARDCEVREINTKEGKEFEELNCFYGTRGASLRLGLFSNKEKNGIPANTLLMVYTFGRNHFGGKDQVEVLRVGTKLNSQVIGGASKLLRFFCRNYPTLKVGQKDYPTDNLIFYNDADHNAAKSMETLGFEFIKRTPGFMNLWLETGEVKHRQPAKHKEITELMNRGEVLPIPMTGTKTFNLLITQEMRK